MYHKARGCGALVPVTTLPQFNSELKDAGIDTIIEEKQAQLDAWLAEQKLVTSQLDLKKLERDSFQLPCENPSLFPEREKGMGVYREMTLLYMPMFFWKISTEQDENRLKGVSNYAE